eukprot:gnl/MRDRNA2_/MRDRNA2_96215_c0_seq1.p1 gnl/MRDRNA2_/MRDRNA2_96215_c0~~gnl/MRDRNA2_/MRDRNA2_96215_c0_seq1.p1  ORF type:complete len:200 (+),score=60.59 gnl/MRDRNA2_/MRDRNA2_96215_c0_seq1:143-742(+)
MSFYGGGNTRQYFAMRDNGCNRFAAAAVSGCNPWGGASSISWESSRCLSNLPTLDQSDIAVTMAVGREGASSISRESSRTPAPAPARAKEDKQKESEAVKKKKSKTLKKEKDAEDEDAGAEKDEEEVKAALAEASPQKKRKVATPDSVMDEAKQEGLHLKLKGMLENPKIVSKEPQVLLDALRKAGGKVCEAKRFLLGK